MRLDRLDVYRLRIPFRKRVRHASASRGETQAMWAVARSKDGTVGYGESCPRRYVTGETPESAAAFIRRYRPRVVCDVTGPEALRRWVRGHRPEIDRNPAAWCAIELALLDVMARSAGRSVESLLGLAELGGSFTYSGVVDDEPPLQASALFERYHELGIRDFKLKLSGDLERDRAKMAWPRRHHGWGIRLRVDANNLWDSPAEAARYLGALECPVFAVEEPLRRDGYGALADLARRIGQPIVLDESFTRVRQLALLAGDSGRWVINLRVSKLGGIVRSLEALEAVRRRGLGVVVGAHVGETSLLTRAALTVASQAGDSLLAQEGAFGTWLLEGDVCDPPLAFAAGGRLNGTAIAALGFGLECSAAQRYLSPVD